MGRGHGITKWGWGMGDITERGVARGMTEGEGRRKYQNAGGMKRMPG